MARSRWQAVRHKRHNNHKNKIIVSIEEIKMMFDYYIRRLGHYDFIV